MTIDISLKSIIFSQMKLRKSENVYGFHTCSLILPIIVVARR